MAPDPDSGAGSTAPQVSPSPTRSAPKPGSKQRKPPSITPRSFNRFFTPKTSSSSRKRAKVSRYRRALRDITATASNRANATSSEASFEGKDLFLSIEHSHRDKRRRRDSESTHGSVVISSPLKRVCNQSLNVSEEEDSETDEEEHHNAGLGHGLRPIAPARHFESLGRELRREVGARKTPYHGGQRMHDSPVLRGAREWQYETCQFYSRPEDIHLCNSADGRQEYTLPFCVAGCNTNSLMAVGTEEGSISILETAKDDQPDFANVYVQFRPHQNAIIDLAFSPDDMLLATACGDQTTQVIDMPSQKCKYIMVGHATSVKQVRFQPGHSSVIATSSRDGSVKIWDMRCRGLAKEIEDVKIGLDPGEVPDVRVKDAIWTPTINTIPRAHAAISQPMHSLSDSLSASEANVKALRELHGQGLRDGPSRRGDISVTALSFLNQGREHLLLTGSEASARIKLWDLRTTHTHRRNGPTPLSTTNEIESHSKLRQFGITSFSLSGDGARLYSVCRDSTVYAYATSHLILGTAPELSMHQTSKPRRLGGAERTGLGPLYGLRHPQFHATSFYVRSAIRHARDDRTELLAVGSSDGAAVVFPTDERYLSPLAQQKPLETSPAIPLEPELPRRPRPPLSRTSSAGRPDDGILIYQHGTALVRGHSKEVTAVTWTKGGELVTASDDFLVRCWREDAETARTLRTQGEGEGRRWRRGWAECSQGWDDVDDDDDDDDV